MRYSKAATISLLATFAVGSALFGSACGSSNTSDRTTATTGGSGNNTAGSANSSGAGGVVSNGGAVYFKISNPTVATCTINS